MKKGDKIKINGSFMFYNGLMLGGSVNENIHVIVDNRRKVGTSAQDITLGEQAFRSLLNTHVIKFPELMREIINESL